MKFEAKLSNTLFLNAFIPRMIKIRQNFQRPIIESIPNTLAIGFSALSIRNTIKPGMHIAITCGSRGISNYKEIIRETCLFVKAQGAEPFLIPAMGSHGGACIEGQAEVLKGYGITEEYCGAQIRSTLDNIVIGKTKEGQEVSINRYAAEADGIIVVNRVKPHTDFRGTFESGLLKMMVVGLGGPFGAQQFHLKGAKHMSQRLIFFGKLILKKAPILFGIAIVENAYDEIAQLEVLPKSQIMIEEPKLLRKAASLMGHILFDDIDLLIVDRVGKDISGDGMDPNVTGRFSTQYANGGVTVKKCTVLDLTDETQGNMVGIGMADTTTRRCVEKCDLERSYPNALTCTVYDPFKIPLIMETDKDAIGACLKFCGDNDKDNPRVVRIQDTKHLSEIWISEALLVQAQMNPQIEVLSEPEFMHFDEFGNLW